MNEKAQSPAVVVPVYIREWMEERALDQKSLAIKMGRSEGAVSKKFKDTSKIDLLWLSEFSRALRVSVPELFDPPHRLRAANPADNLEFQRKLQDAMTLAEQLSDEQIRALLALSPVPASAAPGEEVDPVPAGSMPASE